MSDKHLAENRRAPQAPSIRFRPSAEVIDHLIRQAEKHPLGMDYLVNGSLDSVSATFGVHAFVVDAAREKLGNNGTSAAMVNASHPMGVMANRTV